MSDENDLEQDDIEIEMDDEAPYSASSPVSTEDDYYVGARESLRQQIQSDVEAYLASGGRISEVPANVVSDPPRKPQTSYGGQPI